MKTNIQKELEYDYPVILQYLRNYNARLIKARKNKGYTQKELSLLTDIPCTKISEYELLKKNPSEDEKNEIASALEKSVGYLFPDVLIELVEKKVTLPKKKYLKEKALIVYQQKLEEEEQKKLYLTFLKHDLLDVMKTLNNREREILKLRYGIDGEGPLTLEEIGNIKHISRDRVRQIENHTLRKLRHPTRSNKLKFYLR